MKRKALSKNQLQRAKVIRLNGTVLLKTEDRTMDLDAWKDDMHIVTLAGFMDEHLFPQTVSIYLRSDSFRCYAAEGRHLVALPPSTDQRIRTLAHESLHVIDHAKHGVARHRKEFEACTFEESYWPEGLTEKQRRAGPSYVAHIIQMAIARGAKRFDRASWQYANPSSLHASRQVYFEDFTPELYDARPSPFWAQWMADSVNNEHGEPSALRRPGYRV